MKFISLHLFLMILALTVKLESLSAMEIVFGKKYPIAQKTDSKDLAWQYVQFEKDITGKVIYKLQATHPQGIKLSYLKGKDYLLSEDIQKNMIRNFEVRQPEVAFDENQSVIFEVVLPYDFQTRYLPLKFEKNDGYQEVVIRFRFGDYRFMLASRILNTVSFVEAGPILAAKPIDQLFMKRGQFKKRAPKPVEEEIRSNVQVDDIYNDIKQDLNIQSRIVTDVDAVLASESSEDVMDEFDVLVNKYLPSSEDAKSKSGSESLVFDKNILNSGDGSIKMAGKDIVSYEDSQSLNQNPDLTGNRNSEANIDDIIAQAGALSSSEGNSKPVQTGIDPFADDPALEGVRMGYDDEVESESVVELNENSESLADNEIDDEEDSNRSISNLQPEIDVEEIFGFSNENWVEAKSAPVLVIRPKPVDKKRELASFAAPKRNNFVEMVPSKSSTKAVPGSSLDDLFGGEQNPGATNGLGF